MFGFLSYYVQFENPDMLRIFEEEVQQNQGRSTTVGTREYLLEKAKNEGKKQEAIAIALEMKKDGISITQIAKFTKLTTKEIAKL